MSLPTLDSKWFSAIAPAAILDNAAATGVAIDTRGGDYLEVAILLGATDIAAAGLLLQESATSGGTYTTVSDTVFGTATSPGGSTSVLPSATDDGGIFLFTVDCRKLAFPFVKVLFTAGDGAAGTFVCAVARLSKKDASPTTGLELGAVLNTAWVDKS